MTADTLTVPNTRSHRAEALIIPSFPPLVLSLEAWLFSRIMEREWEDGMKRRCT
jgi:hypothetical protein